MRTRIAALLIASSLAACSGGGGSSGVSSNSTLPSTSSNASNNQTGAYSITEYSLGNSPSEGGIAIASDGSVWTETNVSTNPGSVSGFVRWKNGSVSSYLNNNDYGYLGTGFLTYSGTSIFGGWNQNDGGIFNSLVQSVPQSGGAVYFYPNSYNPNYPQGSNNGNGNNVDVEHLSDGSVWQAVDFVPLGTPYGSAVIQEVTPGNTLINLPTFQGGLAYEGVNAIAAGPDGNVWAAESYDVPGSQIEETNPVIAVYTEGGKLLHTYPTPFLANGMVTGPDKALWFTGPAGLIGRMTSNGTVTTYPTNTLTALTQITVGGDGALWFIEQPANEIGRISVSGAVSAYPVPTAHSAPLGIAGPPANCGASYIVWFAELASGKIAEVVYK